MVVAARNEADTATREKMYHDIQARLQKGHPSVPVPGGFITRLTVRLDVQTRPLRRPGCTMHVSLQTHMPESQAPNVRNGNLRAEIEAEVPAQGLLA